MGQVPTASQSSLASWPSQPENFGSRKRSFPKEPNGGRWRKASDIHPRPPHACAHTNYTDTYTSRTNRAFRRPSMGPRDNGRAQTDLWTQVGSEGAAPLEAAKQSC